MATSTRFSAAGFPDISSFIEAYLRSPKHSWSIGIPGAIGEFMYDDEEEVNVVVDAGHITASTPRGGLQIQIDPDCLCLAYEEISSCTRSWSQNVAFCIPESRARLRKHEVLTCLETDGQAIRSESRQSFIFDLGLGSDILQFCVRSDDQAFVSLLRQNCGRSIFEPENPVAAAVLDKSPARVVMSALGRVEIETRIPRQASETLAGPHTHLLPALLRAKRPATAVIPDGYKECLSLYPEHPAFDKYGEAKPFNLSAYQRFQSLLGELGAEAYVVEKNNAMLELANGASGSPARQEMSFLQQAAWKIAGMQSTFL